MTLFDGVIRHDGPRNGYWGYQTARRNILRIQGTRRPALGGALRMLASDRAYGTFERWITFPLPVDKETLKVKFENGVLEVRVAKTIKGRQSIETVPIP